MLRITVRLSGQDQRTLIATIDCKLGSQRAEFPLFVMDIPRNHPYKSTAGEREWRQKELQYKTQQLQHQRVVQGLHTQLQEAGIKMASLESNLAIIMSSRMELEGRFEQEQKDRLEETVDCSSLIHRKSGKRNCKIATNN
jgi:hypothetical protein